MDMDLLAAKVSELAGFVWNGLLLYLLVGTGIIFTIRTRFIQVRKFGAGFRRLFGSVNLNGEKAGKEGMSSFQAVATSIAAQVGTGNITGCATAMISGGPGAIFWMWLAAFFGMATIYGEAVLAQTFKTKDETGHVIGGPVYYIRQAFKGTFGKILAGFFALAIIFALGFTGNMVQSNAISNAFQEALGIPTWIVGVVLAVVAAFIFLGGVTRIAAVTEKLVPVMACFYLVGGLVMLIANITNLPHAFALIFEGAFNPQAILGGAVGIGVREAMRYGVARGLFSNEAGMGSTPHAHAMAKVEKPQDQGVVAMVCVFIDTFVVLTITALVMITSGALNVGDMAANPAAENMAQVAFSTVFGSFGNFYVAICLLFFAFSTIIGWYFFGEQIRCEGCQGLRLHCGGVRGPGGCAGGSPGLEPLRPVQCADGVPQPAGAAGPQRAGGQGGQGRGRPAQISAPPRKRPSARSSGRRVSSSIPGGEGRTALAVGEGEDRDALHGRGDGVHGIKKRQTLRRKIEVLRVEMAPQQPADALMVPGDPSRLLPLDLRLRCLHQPPLPSAAAGKEGGQRHRIAGGQIPGIPMAQKRGAP